MISSGSLTYGTIPSNKEMQIQKIPPITRGSQELKERWIKEGKIKDIKPPSPKKTKGKK